MRSTKSTNKSLVRPKDQRVSAQVVIESIGRQTDKTFRALSTIKSIHSNEEYDRAALMVKTLKDYVKVAEESHKKISNPLKEALYEVDEHFKPFYIRVEEEQERIKKAMTAFRASVKKKLLKLEQDVESGKIKNISTYVKKAAELSIESEFASARSNWRAEIVDEKKIPRVFLMPDARKITEHLRKGGAPIPGVEWKQVESIAI